MIEIEGLRLALVFVAAVAAGGVNSIAGGGTLLTFPALVAVGLPPLLANTTSTVALWPGAVSAVWGYRRTMDGTRRWAIALSVPSVLGGLTGAWHMLRTGQGRFSTIAPWLVVGATVLFLVQKPMMRWVRRHEHRVVEDGVEQPAAPSASTLAYQFGVAVYGGYFGAGIGILMLAALGFMGFTHIHRMNGLKNWLGLCINAVAAATFAALGMVHWPTAGALAAGAILGGYGGARLAQRVSQQRVRQAIVAIGFGSGLWLLLR
jgi:uncharacterized membrane protein YfcA